MKFTDKQLFNRFEAIKSDRSTLESHIEELARYGLPERLGTLIKTTPGAKYDPNIYDTTLMHAVQVSSAGFHAYSTDPSSRWCALRVDKEGSDIREWLSEWEDILFSNLNDSNFNEQMPEDYKDMFAFGTSHLFEEERLGKKSILSFKTLPFAEVFICLDEDGYVDTIYRYCEMTARSAENRWGDKAGKSVKELMVAGKTESKVQFLHIVMPREERDITKIDNLNMPIASIWFDYKTQEKIEEKGYPEFPCYTTHFSRTSGQTYGSTPAMIALPESKMLNQMSKTTIKAAQLTVEGVLILPHDGYIIPFRRTPGALNMKVSSNKEQIEQLPAPDKLPISLEMENQRRAVINSIMFTDLFLMLAQLRDQPRTATEITERVNERMIILSSVTGSVNRCKLKPLVERALSILWRNGKLPAPPKEAQGLELQVEFVSQLAMAQKQAKNGRIKDLMGTLIAMADKMPEVMDLPNTKKVGRELFRNMNLENLLRDEKELRAIWEAKQQAAMEAKQAEQLQQGAAVVGELAKAGKAGKEASVAGQAK